MHIHSLHQIYIHVAQFKPHECRLGAAYTGILWSWELHGGTQSKWLNVGQGWVGSEMGATNRSVRGAWQDLAGVWGLKIAWSELGRRG